MASLLVAGALAVVAQPARAADDPSADARGWTLRAGVGSTRSSDTVLADTSCNAEAPPALFGCGYRARGEWGRARVGELAVGYRLRSDVRVEIAAFALRGSTLDANANFPRVGTDQPVGADLRSEALLAVAIWEPLRTFGVASGRVVPFLGFGVGGARHHLDPVTFRFPGIGPTSVTVTQGGRSSDGAWLATAGVDIALRPHLALDVAVRRLDLGGAETASGPATIVRPTRTFTIPVAPMRAAVRADEAAVGLLWSF